MIYLTRRIIVQLLGDLTVRWRQLIFRFQPVSRLNLRRQVLIVCALHWGGCSRKHFRDHPQRAGFFLDKHIHLKLGAFDTPSDAINTQQVTTLSSFLLARERLGLRHSCAADFNRRL